MNAKLIVEGKEFDIEIYDPELQKLIAPPKQTGYERVSPKNTYWYADATDVDNLMDEDCEFEKEVYEAANYYSDRTVAKNNARADKLMRQLRRFAVEHRQKELDWNDGEQCHYYIYFDNDNGEFDIDDNVVYRTYGCIYFDSPETAKLAIDTFHDELIWYFTEYKDSL